MNWLSAHYFITMVKKLIYNRTVIVTTKPSIDQEA